MADNVSLTSFVTGTTISSSTMNANLNALNAAGLCALNHGTISGFSVIQGSGTGTFAHGLTLVPYWAGIQGAALQGGGNNQGTWSYNPVTVTSVNITINAQTGAQFRCFVWK